MRRWLVVTAVALLAAVPASGYSQTPSGDKMKDDKTMKDKMEKKDGKMMDKKGDKMMMKDKMMEKGDKMEKEKK
jgi:hypothetical protein